MYVSFSLAISKVKGEDETFARLSTRTRRLRRRSARFVIDSFEIPSGINYRGQQRFYIHECISL